MLESSTHSATNEVFAAKQRQEIKLTAEYIYGLVEGEGCFSFTTISYNRRGVKKRWRVPAFILQMHARDKNLIIAVRDYLGLTNKIYEYKKPAMMDGDRKKVYRRGNQAVLIVRELPSIKNKIVPFFYKRLRGYKSQQFIAWLEKMGTDPEMTDWGKFIYRLYKAGYYDRNYRS